MSVGVSPTISEEEKLDFLIFVSPHNFICHYYQMRQLLPCANLVELRNIRLEKEKEILVIWLIIGSLVLLCDE